MNKIDFKKVSEIWLKLSEIMCGARILDKTE